MNYTDHNFIISARKIHSFIIVSLKTPIMLAGMLPNPQGLPGPGGLLAYGDAEYPTH